MEFLPRKLLFKGKFGKPHSHKKILGYAVTSPEHQEGLIRLIRFNVLSSTTPTIKYLHIPTHQYLHHVQLSNQIFCISLLYIPSYTSHTSLTIY